MRLSSSFSMGGLTPGLGPMIVGSGALPPGTAGVPYSYQFTANGGSQPYSLWTATGLPSWATLDPLLGRLTGTPLAAETDALSVTVLDANSFPSPPAAFTLSIAAGAGFQISTTSLPIGNVGSAYSFQLTAVNGSGAYNWSIDSWSPNRHVWGAIDPTGRLYGIPECDNIGQGNVPDTVVVRCTDRSTLASVTKTFQLNLLASGALSFVSPSVLPIAAQNGAYCYQLLVSGGSPPYMNWKLTSQTGTNGWVITPNGWLECVPTAIATDSINFSCQDSVGRTITGSVSVSTTTQIQLSGIDRTNAGLSPRGLIKLPPARAGQAYSHQLRPADAGTGISQVFSIASGALPAGLALSAAGLISGTPTIAGNPSCSLQCTDSGNVSAAIPIAMNVSPAGLGTRPVGNSGAGFFAGTDGFFYGPAATPFTMVGLNRVHYDQTFSGYATSGCNTVRYGPYLTQFRGTNPTGSQTAATYFGDAFAQHTQAGEFVIFCPFYIPGQTGQLTGDTTPINIGITAAWFCDNYSTWVSSGLAGNAAINVANEWGPQNQNWQFCYAAARDPLSNAWQLPVTSINTGTGVITLASTALTHPLLNAAQIGYVYVAGGNLNKAIAISTTLGGISGAWTVTASNVADVAGATGAATLSGGVIGMLRAVGYTDPLMIDNGSFGQVISNIILYGAAVGTSDPQHNIVLTEHAYNSTVNFAAQIAGVTIGANAQITLNSSSLTHPLDPTNSGGTTNSGISDYYITGVQGVTGLSGETPASQNVTGSPGAWKVTTSVTTTGAYTGGGFMMPNAVGNPTGFRFHIDRVVAALAAVRQSGIAVAITEFGPNTTLGPTPVQTCVQEIIQVCNANGIGFIPWALDSVSPFNIVSNGSGTYTVPAQLSPYGVDAILNPRYGIHCMAATAPVVPQTPGTAPRRMFRGFIQSNALMVAWWPPATWPGVVPDGYNVYRNGVKVNSTLVVGWSLGGSGGGAGSSMQYFYIDQTVSPATTYNYTVRSSTGGVESADGPVLTITTLAGVAGSTVPIPPTAWTPDPFSLPTGGTTFTCTTLAQFQSALSAAHLGDVIFLQAGTVFANTAFTPSFTIPVYTQGAGSSPYLYIISTAYASLPPPGTRVGPADAVNMPTIQVINTNGVAVHLAEGCKFIRFVGINFAPVPGNTTSSLFACISFTFPTDNTPLAPADHITWDRCLFGNDSTSANFSWLKRAFLGVFGNFINIDSCYMSGFTSATNGGMNPDSNAILGVGAGPGIVNNCFIEAGSENSLWGGVFVPENIPHDWVYSNNTSNKPANWGAQFTGYISGSTLTVVSITNGNNPININWPIHGAGVSNGSPLPLTRITAFGTGTGGTGTYTVTPSQTVGSAASPVAMDIALGLDVKNHLEHKVGTRFLYKNNILQTNWGGHGDQQGRAFVLTPRDQFADGNFNASIGFIDNGAGGGTYSGVAGNLMTITAAGSGTIFIGFGIVGAGIAGVTGPEPVVMSQISGTAGKNGVYQISGAPLAVPAGTSITFTKDTPTLSQWNHISDMDYQNNRILACGDPILIASGVDPLATAYLERVRFQNNQCWESPPSSQGGGTASRGITGFGATPDVIIDHNTLIFSSSTNITSRPYFGGIGQLREYYGGFYPPSGSIADRWTISNNVLDGTYSIVWFDLAQSLHTSSPTALNSVFTNYVWTNNVIVNDTVVFAAPAANQFFAHGYINLGMQAFVDNNTAPATPASWNITSGVFATASTTNGPLGSIF